MIDSISLISGHPMPLLGLGTWQLRGQACKKAVQMAYELAYLLLILIPPGSTKISKR